MSTIAYIYMWTHIPSGMWYLGSRTAKNCHPFDGYICSSIIVKALIRHDASEWERKILETGDQYYIRQLEEYELRKRDAVKDPMSFNKNYAAAGFTALGYVWINNGLIESYIKDSQLHIFLERGWSKGRSVMMKETCTKNLKHGPGDKNTAYGKVWMTNRISHGLSDENTKNILLNEGWKEGLRNETLTLLSDITKNYYATRSVEEDELHRKKLSHATKKYHNTITPEQKLKREKNISAAIKIWRANFTPEEAEKQNALLNGKTETCIHCGILTNKGNFKRWHGNKCKTLRNTN
jgi:hypothetical protein